MARTVELVFVSSACSHFDHNVSIAVSDPTFHPHLPALLPAPPPAQSRRLGQDMRTLQQLESRGRDAAASAAERAEAEGQRRVLVTRLYADTGKAKVMRPRQPTGATASGRLPPGLFSRAEHAGPRQSR
jgi:hypothetical protein